MIQSRPLILTILVMILVAGCGGQAAGEPTAEIETEAAPPSEGTPEGGHPRLDPCTIFTADDAAGVLGGPVESDPTDINIQFGACPYKSVDGLASVSVGAGYGDEAKQILLLAFGLRAGFSTDQAFKDWFEDVSSRAGTMSVVEMVNVLYGDGPPSEGETVEAVGNFGDAAYLSWNSGEMSGGLIAAEGDTIVMITIKGMGESAARPLLQPLAREILGRLPDGFRTLPPKEG